MELHLPVHLQALVVHPQVSCLGALLIGRTFVLFASLFSTILDVIGG
jgi:hypothetical protein